MSTVHDHYTRPRFGLNWVPYKTNTRYFRPTVRLAGPKLWNVINTDICGKCSLNTFKTAYEKLLISSY